MRTVAVIKRSLGFWLCFFLGSDKRRGKLAKRAESRKKALSFQIQNLF